MRLLDCVQDEEPEHPSAARHRAPEDEEDERLLGGSDADEGADEEVEDEDPDEAAERQRRLLEDVAARGGRRRPLPVLSEAAPESEYNLPPLVSSAGAEPPRAVEPGIRTCCVAGALVPHAAGAGCRCLCCLEAGVRLQLATTCSLQPLACVFCGRSSRTRLARWSACACLASKWSFGM